ncbi:MAG: hypothetical protein AAGF07_04970 [Patescibacteria group bacterium]
MFRKTKLDLLALGGSFIIFFFSMVSGITAIVLSFLIQYLDIKDWFFDLQRLSLFFVLMCITFLIMTVVVFWVDSFLIEVYNFFKIKLGDQGVGIVAISTFISLFLGLYLILPNFFTFVRDYFWL